MVVLGLLGWMRGGLGKMLKSLILFFVGIMVLFVVKGGCKKLYCYLLQSHSLTQLFLGVYR